MAIVSLAVCGVIRCTAPVDVADGGASGTDVGFCKVLGTITDTLGRPVAEGLVRLRPFDYIVGRKDGDVVKRDVYSYADGRYIFDSIPAGHYTIECLSPDSLGQIVDCVIDSIDTIVVLPLAIVRPMAVLIGKSVGGKIQGEGADRSVQAIGLERSAPIDNEGNFELRVPAGYCWLNLHGIDPENPDIDTTLYLRPGRNEMSAQPPHNSPCENLICELKVVRDILDSNGLQSINPESVVVVAGNRIVELRLRGKGIRILPLAVCRIARLRVIDVGNNKLRELPHTMKLFFQLEELLADSNKIRMIDPSLGTLQSLRKLDLSFNQLQSVEPITYLSLSYLDVSGNMLCNIGDSTRKWLDEYDPDWKDTQVCR